jgi:predicted TIM-barrel fold metal-dependent hydrolase
MIKNKLSFCFLLFFLLVVSPFVYGQNYTGPIIDFHLHPSLDDEEIAKKPDLVIDNIRKQMDRAGVQSSALITIAHKGDIERTVKENDQIIALAKKSPGRFFPIASVHPDDGELALKELERLAKLGIKVIKLHPNTQRFDVASPTVNAVTAKCGELSLAILFDSYSPFDCDEIGKFVKLALSNPKTNIVLAHMGGPKFPELIVFDVLNKYPWYQKNVWFDLSAVATIYADSPYKEQLAWTIRKIGVDRMIFGSDYPLYLPSDAVEAVRKLGFNLEEQKAIFYSNTLKLLKLEELGSK